MINSKLCSQFFLRTPPLWEATKCRSSPSKRNTLAYRLPQRETALRTIVSNTGCTSAGEPRITRRISAVAFCCSRASDSSWVSAASVVLASEPRGLRELRSPDRGVRDADLDARFLRCTTMITRPAGEQKSNCTSNNMRASFGRPITGHLESLQTHDFNCPAYRACVARASMCIVRIVTSLKSPSASATFSHRPGGGSVLISKWRHARASLTNHAVRVSVDRHRGG